MPRIDTNRYFHCCNGRPTPAQTQSKKQAGEPACKQATTMTTIPSYFPIPSSCKINVEDLPEFEWSRHGGVIGEIYSSDAPSKQANKYVELLTTTSECVILRGKAAAFAQDSNYLQFFYMKEMEVLAGLCGLATVALGGGRDPFAQGGSDYVFNAMLSDTKSFEALNFWAHHTPAIVAYCDLDEEDVTEIQRQFKTPASEPTPEQNSNKYNIYFNVSVLQPSLAMALHGSEELIQAWTAAKYFPEYISRLAKIARDPMRYADWMSERAIIILRRLAEKSEAARRVLKKHVDKDSQFRKRLVEGEWCFCRDEEFKRGPSEEVWCCCDTEPTTETQDREQPNPQFRILPKPDDKLGHHRPPLS